MTPAARCLNFEDLPKVFECMLIQQLVGARADE
jgi:hypothetical protein